MGRDTEFNYGFNTEETVTYDCTCAIICPVCRRRFGLCTEVHEQLNQPYKGEEDTMIPRGNNSNNNRGTQQRRRNGLPFLSTKDATHTPQPAVIVAARVEDDNFRPGNSVVALKLKFKGQHFLYNLRTNNPVLDALCEAFGDDESTWANKEISIFNEEDTFNGKVWLRMEAAQEEQASRRKK